MFRLMVGASRRWGEPGRKRNPLLEWRTKPSPLVMLRIEELLQSLGEPGADLLRQYFKAPEL